MEYHLIGYRENPLVRLDIMINNDPVDSLAMIVHRDDCGRKLKEPIQAPSIQGADSSDDW